MVKYISLSVDWLSSRLKHTNFANFQMLRFSSSCPLSDGCYILYRASLTEQPYELYMCSAVWRKKSYKAKYTCSKKAIRLKYTEQHARVISND